MGDTDQNDLCQPNQMSDAANTNVALLSRTVDTADHGSNRTYHIGHREWTDGEKRRAVKLNQSAENHRIFPSFFQT